MKSTWLVPIAGLALVGLIVSCDSNDPSGPTAPSTQLQIPTPTPPNPLIRTIAPAPAAPGQAVTIAGENFGTDPRRVAVRFNGQPGHLSSVAEQLIVAIIPISQGPGTISVEVTVAGAARAATSTLTVSLLSPSITGLEPAAAFAGGTVKIKGAHFGIDADQLDVTFGDESVVVKSVLDDAIVAVIPPTLPVGPATVSVSRDRAPAAATATLMVLRLPEAVGTWTLTGEIVMEDSTTADPTRTRCELSGSLDLSSQLRLRLGGTASILADCGLVDAEGEKVLLPIQGGLIGRIAEDGGSLTFSVGLPGLELATPCTFNADRLSGNIQGASGTIASCPPVTDEFQVAGLPPVGVHSATWSASRR
jgi:hypothetical protein